MPQQFIDFDIDVEGRTGPETKVLCPKCSALRVKRWDPCLSVNIEKGVWNCHNCGWKGSLTHGEHSYDRPQPGAMGNDQNLWDRMKSFFLSRGISEPTIKRYSITISNFVLGGDTPEPVIHFPYFRRGDLINVKHRSLDRKRFRQEPRAEKIFYSLDDVSDCDTAIIVEGEMDKLSLVEVGIMNAISVPDGAPAPDSSPSDKKFEYINNCWKELDRCKKFVIAVDNDEPGRELSKHLIRRLGVERCFVVRWPDGCKDANDVLMLLGARALIDLMTDVRPVPIPCEVPWEQLEEDLALNLRRDPDLGLSTGFASLDRNFVLAPGMFNVMTGIPGHGKSELLDAFIVNSAKQHGWIWSVFSFENRPSWRHLKKLVGKWTGLPVLDNVKVKSLPEAKIAECVKKMREFIILNECDEGMSPEGVLDIFRMQILRYGVNACVIDPWNALDHTTGYRSFGQTEYIGLVTNTIRQFCYSHNVALFLVVHPSKQKKGPSGKFSPPSAYDMAGSAHWFNRPDFILCVYRDIMNEGAARDLALIENSTTVYIQKSRHSHLGHVGECQLFWDASSGRFSDMPVHQQNERTREPAVKVQYEDEPRFPGFN